MTYTPLDHETLFSSVMRCGLGSLGVWYAILASKDREGITALTPQTLALLTKEPVESVQAAWDRLAAPDPESHNPDYEGRRIVRLPDGRWLVVSSEIYRQKHAGDMYRSNAAARKQRQREREKVGGSEGARAAQPSASASRASGGDAVRLGIPGVSETPAPSLPANGREVVHFPPRGPANPLVDRAKLEPEFLRLVRELAELTDRDPVEVAREATSYDGARTTPINPASMSDDRLANSVMDLRANLAEAREAAEAKRGANK